MQNLELNCSLADSLNEDVTACLGDLAELGLDAITAEGLLKDIPFISTAVSIYRIGHNIRERHNLKKLVTFLNEINNGIENQQKREEYAFKIRTNNRLRNQELEYLLIIIDRYISYEKPKMIAKLYLAYLDRMLDWVELTMYAEVIDRFLPGDYTMLQTNREVSTIRNLGSEALLRLMAQGLVAEKATTNIFEDNGRGGFSVTLASMDREHNQYKTYQRTEFGDKLVDILGDLRDNSIQLL